MPRAGGGGRYRDAPAGGRPAVLQPRPSAPCRAAPGTAGAAARGGGRRGAPVWAPPRSGRRCPGGRGAARNAAAPVGACGTSRGTRPSAASQRRGEKGGARRAFVIRDHLGLEQRSAALLPERGGTHQLLVRQPGLLGRSGDEEWGFREKVAVVLLVVFCFLILRGIRVLLLQHLTETALRTTGFVRERAACVRLGPAVSCSAVPKPCLRAARLPFVVAVPGGQPWPRLAGCDCMALLRKVHRCHGESLASLVLRLCV